MHAWRMDHVECGVVRDHVDHGSQIMILKPDPRSQDPGSRSEIRDRIPDPRDCTRIKFCKSFRDFVVQFSRPF